MKIGIIGYGSMGKMLLWKFAEKGSIAKQNLYVFNKTIEKCDEAKDIAQIVSAKEIAEAVKDQLGIDIDKKKLQLAAPLKEVGTTTVDLKLHPKVTAGLKVNIKGA